MLHLLVLLNPEIAEVLPQIGKLTRKIFTVVVKTLDLKYIYLSSTVPVV